MVPPECTPPLLIQKQCWLRLYNNANCSLDEHTILLDAIEAGDKEKALSLMAEHLNHIRSKLSLDGETASNDLHVVFSNVIKNNALNKA